jgi:hypothetical protein
LLGISKKFCPVNGIAEGKKKRSVAIEENTTGSYQSTFLKIPKLYSWLYKTQDEERGYIFF